eukprot:TRINITY_DN38173_c0_g1_i1.p1 TRINITY_DN38173_c0_g1~~TRINITY_DN38173_c0_g1_i1.p1  ORF type:complete len:269 (-),score=30.72 TRINITY_DN38173_c0_g1_i1:215-1021(-)
MGCDASRNCYSVEETALPPLSGSKSPRKASSDVPNKSAEYKFTGSPFRDLLMVHPKPQRRVRARMQETVASFLKRLATEFDVPSEDLELEYKGQVIPLDVTLEQAQLHSDAEIKVHGTADPHFAEVLALTECKAYHVAVADVLNPELIGKVTKCMALSEVDGVSTQGKKVDEVLHWLHVRPLTLKFLSSDGTKSYEHTFAEHLPLKLRLTDRGKLLNDELARLSEEKLQCDKASPGYNKLKRQIQILDDKITASRAPVADKWFGQTKL